MINADTKGFRWGVGRRLEFVEFRLFWEGGVNRSDLVREFGVSVPQASKDLALYQEQAPGNIAYDRSEKRYFASPTFRPQFIELDADAYLEELASMSHQPVATTEVGGNGPLMADRLPIPGRVIDSAVLRSLLAAARESRSIEILYQSMSSNRPEPLWRRISPHAFASDGLRWHARGYCHTDEKFKDFILSRCLDVRSISLASDTAPVDHLWKTHFSVVLVPNSNLTKSQQAVIAQDFGMENNQVSVPVRRAMLYYFSKRLRLDLASNDPKETPVVIANRDDFDSALAESMK